MGTWYNDDGLLVRYGQDQARETQSLMAPPRTAGVLNHMVVDVNWDDLPGLTTDSNNDGTKNKFSGQDAFIPAGSMILRAWLVVEEAFAGGTSYDIGLYDEDGSAIDADGLVAAVTLAELSGSNTAHELDGALVGGTAHIGSSNGYLVVAETGTFTAGKAKLFIEYMQVSPGADVTV